jgi:hypothetical protein
MRVRCILALACLSAIQPGIAAGQAHHVMLSWRPQGQPWHFAFYAVLPLPYSVGDVSKPDMVAVGIPALKQHLSQHQPWRDIVWRDLVGSRTYPDARTCDEIIQFARAHSVNLEVLPTITD